MLSIVIDWKRIVILFESWPLYDDPTLLFRVVHYEESFPFQPMHLWLVSKSTISVTSYATSLCGTMVKENYNCTCNYESISSCKCN